LRNRRRIGLITALLLVNIVIYALDGLVWNGTISVSGGLAGWAPRRAVAEVVVTVTVSEAATSPVPATSTPSPYPTKTPRATVLPARSSPNPPVRTHTVQPGDTLYSIAAQYGWDIGTLVRANHLANPNAVYVGQQLIIPYPPTATPSPTVAPPTTTPTYAPPTATAHASDSTLAVTPTPWPSPTGISGYAPWPFGPGPTIDPLPLPEHMFTVLLLGKDQGTASWRTDTILLLSIDPDTQRAGLLSIPRDLWVSIPGYGQERINTVDFRGEITKYPGGGPALLKRTIRENLGIPVHYYVRIDFRVFTRIINILGGVDVPVDCALRDVFLDSTSPTGRTALQVSPGMQHMDGDTALRYARSRHTTNDFDRARRQQQVLKAAWKKALSLDLFAKAPQLWQEFHDSIKTDLTLGDVLALGRFGTKLRPQAIQNRVIDWRVTTNWTTPMGAMVLLPNRPKIHQLLSEYFTALQAPEPAESGPPVRMAVENDTAMQDWTELVATRLRWHGMDVTIDTPRGTQQQSTQLIDYTGNTQAIEQVRAEFSLTPGQVVHQKKEKSPVDLRLIIGYDLQTCKRWSP